MRFSTCSLEGPMQNHPGRHRLHLRPTLSQLRAPRFSRTQCPGNKAITQRVCHMGPSWVRNVQQDGPDSGLSSPAPPPSTAKLWCRRARGPRCWPPIWGPELGALCSLLRPPRAAASVPAFTMTSKLRGAGWRQVGRNTGSRSPGAPSCPVLSTDGPQAPPPFLPGGQHLDLPCFASSAVCPRPPFGWDTQGRPVLGKVLTCHSSGVTIGALQAFGPNNPAILPLPEEGLLPLRPRVTALRVQHTI